MDKYLNVSSNRSDIYIYEQIICSAGDVKNFESWMFSEEPREKQIPV